MIKFFRDPIHDVIRVEEEYILNLINSYQSSAKAGIFLQRTGDHINATFRMYIGGVSYQ